MSVPLVANPNHGGPPARRWLPLVVALACVATAAFATEQVNRTQRTTARASVSLMHVTVLLERLNAKEWEAVATGAVTEETDQEIAAISSDLDQRLTEFGGDKPVLSGDVVASISKYRIALNYELELLRTGDIEHAEEWDEATVDPRFEAAIEALRAESDRLAATTARTASSSRVRLRMILATLVVSVDRAVRVVPPFDCAIQVTR